MNRFLLGEDLRKDKSQNVSICSFYLEGESKRERTII